MKTKKFIRELLSVIPFGIFMIGLGILIIGTVLFELTTDRKLRIDL